VKLVDGQINTTISLKAIWGELREGPIALSPPTTTKSVVVPDCMSEGR
jgi:hypothetical protein